MFQKDISKNVEVVHLINFPRIQYIKMIKMTTCFKGIVDISENMLINSHAKS